MSPMLILRCQEICLVTFLKDACCFCWSTWLSHCHCRYNSYKVRKLLNGQLLVNTFDFFVFYVQSDQKQTNDRLRIRAWWVTLNSLDLLWLYEVLSQNTVKQNRRHQWSTGPTSQFHTYVKIVVITNRDCGSTNLYTLFQTMELAKWIIDDHSCLVFVV